MLAAEKRRLGLRRIPSISRIKPHMVVSDPDFQPDCRIKINGIRLTVRNPQDSDLGLPPGRRRGH